MVDEMDLLSRMKDAAPLRAEAFGEARTKLRAAMAADAQPEMCPRQGGHPQKLTRGARRKAGFGITAVAAAAAAVAVAAVALGITSSPTRSHPASRPASRLAAYAVSRQAGGIIQVSMFGQLRDPAALQATLRADGVPASVTFIGQQNPACQAYSWPPGPPPSFQRHPQPNLPNRVFGPPFSNPQGDAFVIHLAALPPGVGVQVAAMKGIPSGPAGPWPYPKGSGHAVVSLSLVKASPQCTGS
jgi:hypothetical protein